MDLFDVSGISTFNGISTFKNNVFIETGKLLQVGGTALFKDNVQIDTGKTLTMDGNLTNSGLTILNDLTVQGTLVTN